MYFDTWNLYEDDGDVFLLRSGAPLAFEIDFNCLGGRTWPDLRLVLDQLLDGTLKTTPKNLPIKPVIHKTQDLYKRLGKRKTLIEWGDGIGHIKVDELPEAAMLFIFVIDTPTYEAVQMRERFSEEGLFFDGSWMPSTIREIATMLWNANFSPLKNQVAPWLFREVTTAQGGSIVILYEITCAKRGITLRGLSQKQVINDLENFLNGVTC